MTATFEGSALENASILHVLVLKYFQHENSRSWSVFIQEAAQMTSTMSSDRSSQYSMPRQPASVGKSQNTPLRSMIPAPIASK